MAVVSRQQIAYFNPLPLYRGRPRLQSCFRILSHISILSLYTEGDAVIFGFYSGEFNFNPLPLYRGRLRAYISPFLMPVFQSSPSIQRETCVFKHSFVEIFISILSLYTEGDVFQTFIFCRPKNFNPLPLYRGRRCFNGTLDDFVAFQSSPSIQRETNSQTGASAFPDISILSLYTEGDQI